MTKRSASARSPATASAPAASASASGAPAVDDRGDRHRIACEQRVGTRGLGAADEDLAAFHAPEEALAAELEADRRGDVPGPLGRQHGAERQHQRRRRQRQRGIVLGRSRRPAAQLLDDGLGLIAPGRQLVDLRRGGRGQAAARHYAARLEPLEPLRQDIGADSGQAGAQLVETAAAVHKLAQDQQRPALADQLEPERGAAGVVIPAGLGALRGLVGRLSHFL